MSSLLDRGNQTILVYPEVATTDDDGNLVTRASNTPVEVRGVIQPLAASGTSGRRAEQDNEGYESEANYRLRVSRKYDIYIGAQSKVSWRGLKFSVVGDGTRYTGSKKTQHVDYVLRRN